MIAISTYATRYRRQCGSAFSTRRRRTRANVPLRSANSDLMADPITRASGLLCTVSLPAEARLFKRKSAFVPAPATARPKASGGSGARRLVVAPFGKLAFPRERMARDRREVIELRLPAEQRADAVRFRHDLRRVAGAARRRIDPEIDARHALDRVDHLEHREAAAVAAVERGRSSAVAQIGERV